MEAKKTERIWFLDALRILAAFSVVLIHAAVYQGAEAGTDAFYELDFWSVLPRFAVPIFVMISGALFLDPKRELSWRKIWGKYIPRLALVFYFWSAAYVLFGMAAGKGFSWQELLFGHYHMWFLPMIAVLYAVTPMLRRVFANRKVLLVALPVLMVAAWFGNQVFPYCGYLVYYLLGVALFTTDFKGWQRVILYVLGLAGVATSVVISWRIQSTEVNTAMRADYTPMVMAAAVALFVGFSKVRWGRTAQKIISVVAPTTLGIYMVHLMVLGAIARVGMEPDTFLHVPLVAALTFLGSFVVIFVMRKVPILKNLA